MKSWKKWIAGIVLGAVCAGVGVFAGHRRAESSSVSSSEASDTDAATPAEPTPVASVTTVPIRSGRVTHLIVAYGTVVTQPGDIQIFSVPYECRVKWVAVAAGEQVDRQTPLIEIEPSPDAKLQYQEDQVALEAARKDLAQTQERFNAKLAITSDLLQAQQAVSVAELHLRNLEQQGVNTTAVTLLSARGPGIVSQINAQAGQIVPAGQPLVETVAQNQIQVRLGVEPDEVARIQQGQPVELFPVSAAGSQDVAAKVRLITRRVNPDTRLVDVFVTPADDNLMLDGFVRAEIVQTTGIGLVVPRQAVLPGDEGNLLFTVKDGHVVEHTVNILSQNNDETLISGQGLIPGDLVVVSGNYELEDGMAVNAQSAATTTASTEPAS